ncbi:uncharacterized protein LOC143633143 isoform X2 [Bidens hawaiensis]|uniref:uncharacterized protein LOC143633143 isoform X2 n=1 Tax=Bidens hawaiensis TaxID=980011 RepID=UPI004049CCB5
MANDNRRSQRVKDDESSKSKKKTVTPDASPSNASSSRRSSRETSSIYKVKDDENNKSSKKTVTPNASPASSSRRSGVTPVKENVVNTRKSERLGKKKPSGVSPVKGKSGKTHEQVTTTPTKTNDRRKKSDAGVSASPSTSSMKSKKEEVFNGGKKRKRGGASVRNGSSKAPRLQIEGDDNDKESEEKSSESNSSSSSCREVEKPHNLKSVEDKDDGDDGCGDSNGEESTEKASKRQNRTSYQDEPIIATAKFIDLVQDRTPCEAAATAEFVEKNDVVSRTDTVLCIVCKKLRCDHLPLVPESVWDMREVEVSEASGLQKQKQYFVKYKGVAHIHNQWIPESQLLLEAPLLAENYSKNGSVKWNEEWIVPHQLLKKRLLLSLEPACESKVNTEKVLNYHYEWLVQWQGLDYEQATWESESISVLDSPEGHNLIKDYEKLHGNANEYASLDNDKIEEIPLNIPHGVDNIHSSYVKSLHDAWTKGPISIVFDDQERTTRIVLFILSLKSASLPFLLITRSDSLSQWEAMFSKIAPLNDFKVSIDGTHEKTSSKLLHVRKDNGQLAFQLLLYPVDAFVKDLNVLKAVKWEAIIVDESQSSDISSHFSHIKSLSADKRLLVFCGPLGVSNLDVMPLLDCGVITATELGDISKLKETLSKLIAYECKSSSSSKFVEYWVPVQISNVQLEQYCSMLLSKSMALSACSKSDATGALHDILVSNRKCCDHPYVVDLSLQAVLAKGLEPIKFLDVGIKASGKFQFLDVILPEMRKRQLRVLIVYHQLSGSGKDSTSTGDILDDFVRQRFGVDSYERVDGIMIPGKKQAALNNFNNKEMGRFIFLLEHRACLPSIKLSSVDTIILFDSDWNPANDLRVLQRIAIDSHSEQIMTFRLYTSSTLEEQILRLAEHNVTITGKLQNLSRSTSDKLLMQGATYLFKKLDVFHNDSSTSSVECWLSELMEEFLDLISYKSKNKDTGKLKITRAKPVCSKNVTLPNEPDGEPPHVFWKNLLAGRDPCWRYLSTNLTPRQRSTKRPQYLEQSQSPSRINATNDDVGRKRKKITDITEPVASKPIIEESVITNNVIDHVASKPVVKESGIANNATDPVASKPVVKEAQVTNNVTEPVASMPVIEEGEMSFQDLLKLKISRLCEVLKLSEDVKIMVERFLGYVVGNFRVNDESESTLHAFLISLCWIGAELLKRKLDRKQSISLANEKLSFSCQEDKANSVYLKLQLAKEMFLIHTNDQTKTGESVDSSSNDNDDAGGDDGGGGVGDCNRKDSDLGSINPDTSNAPENQNNNNLVQPLVSLASGESVPTDPVNTCSTEASPLQADEEPCLPSENQSNIPLGEQQPDTPIPQVPNQDGTPNQSNGSRSGNGNQGAPRKKSSDPLQSELERLFELKNAVVKFYDTFKLKLKSDQEKEIEEMTARINAKYEAKNKDADAAFQSKKKEVDGYFNRVVMNKVLAEAFKSKCQDVVPIGPPEIEGSNLPHLPQFQNGVTFSSSPAQSSRSQPVTETQPPLQIVNQSSQLFSTPPTKPPSNNNNNTNPYMRQPPTFNSNPPTRPPPSTIIPTSIPRRPPPGINLNATSRPPPKTIPTAPAKNYRTPAPHIRPYKPPTPHDQRVIPHQQRSQTPTSFWTNNNGHPAQNSPRSLRLTSSQPASTSFKLPPLYSMLPPGHRPATPTSRPQPSLPPMPSVSISHTGLYNPTPKPTPTPTQLPTPPTPPMGTNNSKQGLYNPTPKPTSTQTPAPTSTPAPPMGSDNSKQGLCNPTPTPTPKPTSTQTPAPAPTPTTPAQPMDTDNYKQGGFHPPKVSPSSVELLEKVI